MHYIIMDLEWNNSYNKKLKGFFNEILETEAARYGENKRERRHYAEYGAVGQRHGLRLEATVHEGLHRKTQGLYDPDFHGIAHLGPYSREEIVLKSYDFGNQFVHCGW